MEGPMERFERLARVARDEAAPSPDVAEAVMRFTRQIRSDARPDIFPWLATAVAGAAALVMAVLGVQAYQALTSPLAGWMQQLTNWGIL